MKVRDAARRLRLHPNTILELIHRGDLHATRNGRFARAYDITEDALDDLIERARIKPTAPRVLR